MARPTTREQFKARCLRQLGSGVIDVNVTNEQIDDCVDIALDYYHDYHYDGSELVYLAHQITDTDKSNKYLTIPELVIGVVDVFPMGTSVSSNSLFNLRYQLALNELYSFTVGEASTYYIRSQNIAMIEDIFVGKKPFRYSRHRDRLYIDTDWSALTSGEYLMMSVYEKNDPDTWSDIWADRWLTDYTTQLIKRQWGTNLKKFGDMRLPGGMVFNGQTIYDEADTEIKRLQERMLWENSVMPEGKVG